MEFCFDTLYLRMPTGEYFPMPCQKILILNVSVKFFTPKNFALANVQSALLTNSICDEVSQLLKQCTLVKGDCRGTPKIRHHFA